MLISNEIIQPSFRSSRTIIQVISCNGSKNRRISRLRSKNSYIGSRVRQTISVKQRSRV